MSRNTTGSTKTDDVSIDNTQKDPKNWVTGDESMTGAQKSYLHTLAEAAGAKVDDSLTKAEASEKIDQLKKHSPRSK